jgi:hypothetical protein
MYAVNFTKNEPMLPTGRKFGGKPLKNQIKSLQLDENQNVTEFSPLFDLRDISIIGTAFCEGEVESILSVCWIVFVFHFNRFEQRYF